MEILVLVETNQEKDITKPSKQVLMTARNIIDSLGGKLTALLIGFDIDSTKV